MRIKARPVLYAGTRFRSTLEAQWAIALNRLGIPWVYEKEVFELMKRAKLLAEWVNGYNSKHAFHHEDDKPE